MFPNRTGSYFKESKTIVKYHFQPLLDRLEIKYISLYATRHTFSTITDNLRVHPEFINSMAGNSEKVRQDHYVTFEMTRERQNEAQTHLEPVNNVFFDYIRAEAK